MPGPCSFEYAVIRVVPLVEREEFLNVGVILFCKQQNFLKTLCMPDYKKLSAISKQLELAEIEAHLRSFERISAGDKNAGPIAGLDTASRFRWLTATRSTVIQTSKVHPGLSEDPQATLEKLFAQLVS